MDKTSVLGDTIEYIKHLQERLKTVEEQTENQTMVVKKSQIVEDDENENEDEDGESCSSTSYGQPLPEIETRISDKSVYLKIQCEKLKGVLVTILSVLEKLNLAVRNISVMPFGSSALDITITAEMQEISVAAKDIVKNLRSALLQAASGN
ncbi:hypothetical protein CDL12_30208 [Handroanthus impetiginosus]|uniref:ACT domain-containing protein n=1 Tax=Handroanthus impetiginosus TaxID=429701 RepID=A0A2G9FW93_9LAMI|nr:hypothetical protein CDL12_30208 [Handroanthus impetiginosus]